MTITNAAKFFALLLTAIALIPSGAHLFEMPAKIELPRDDYLTVQAIYRGWALFGIVLIGALAATLFLAVRLWGNRGRRWLAGGAFLLVAATLAIFFTWVYPANQATANWTVAPDNWRALRMHWEYGHATNALLTFAALCLVCAACIRPDRK